MGLRRSSILVALAFAALATSHPVALAAHAPQVKAHISEVRCQDLSRLVASFPMAGQFEGDPKHVPLVIVDIRSDANAPRGSYTVDIDGARKATGMTGGGAQTSNGVSVANDKDSHVVVRVGQHVILDQMISVHC